MKKEFEHSDKWCWIFVFTAILSMMMLAHAKSLSTSTSIAFHVAGIGSIIMIAILVRENRELGHQEGLGKPVPIELQIKNDAVHPLVVAYSMVHFAQDANILWLFKMSGSGGGFNNPNNHEFILLDQKRHASLIHQIVKFSEIPADPFVFEKKANGEIYLNFNG